MLSYCKRLLKCGSPPFKISITQIQVPPCHNFNLIGIAALRAAVYYIHAQAHTRTSKRVIVRDSQVAL